MEKIRVKVITPYEGLGQLVQKFAPLYPNYDLTVAYGDLTDGVERAKNAESDGIDIILSRGGTADLIEKTVSIPVLKIGVSGYDILRTIMLTNTYTGKVAIAGFDSITHGCRAISDLLQKNIEIFTIDTTDEVENMMQRLKQEGFNTVVGDVVTTTAAKKMGLNCLLVTSGEESVRAALDEVARYMKYLKESRDQNRLLKGIIHAAPNTTVILDQNKKEILRSPEIKQELAQRLRDFVWITLRDGEFYTVEKIQGEGDYQITGKAVSLPGSETIAAFYCQPLQLTMEDRAGISISSVQDLNKFSYNMFSSENDHLKRMVERIKTLSKAGASVLIEGEAGVGKDTLAGLVCHVDDTVHQPMISVDCMQVTQGVLEGVLSGANPAFNGIPQYALYFRRFDWLSLEKQKSFLKLIYLARKHQLIFSCRRNLEQLAEKGEFLKELIEVIAPIRVWVPPLRQRKEDIKNLSIIFLGKINEKLGKQIAGLDKQALALVEEYRWDGNFDQFERVLENAAKICSGSYIGKKELSPLLAEEKSVGKFVDISSHKTLNEMEKEIIRAVLKEEGMNQVRTALRLGISRTTLWRYLQQS